MRQSISKMAKYAETIGRRKFLSLSQGRQHELLASLAWEAGKNQAFSGFIRRYGELQSWSGLDRYYPSDWLSEEEALQEFFLFHNNFCKIPLIPDENDAVLSWQPRFDVTVLLDQVRSPFNAGSVLRIIDNFGFKGLVHNSPWLRMKHPQLCKAARGSEKWIPVEFRSDLTTWLKNRKIPVVGIENDPEAITITDWKPPSQCVLIVGNEAYGIASGLRQCCDHIVQIPMFGFKKSMNLHHALAIVAQRIVEKAVCSDIL